MVFTLEQDRILNADVLIKAWCPRMDMLALVLANGTLEVRRLSWQRLGESIKIKGVATSLVWKADGKVIALGHDDGRIRLVSVDRYKVQDLVDSHAAPVSALCWVDVSDEIDDFDPLDGASLSTPRESRVRECFDPLLILPSETGMNANAKFAPAKIERGFDPEQLGVLVSGDDEGAIKLHASGDFPIGSISVSEALSGSWFIPRPNRRSSLEFHIDAVDLSPDLRHLVAAIRLCSVRHPAVLIQAVWDVSFLRCRHHEVRALATHAAHVEFLLKYVQNGLEVGAKIWRSARKTFDMKFSVLDTLFREGAERQSVADALTALAVAGSLNQALMQFFSTYLPEQSVSRISKSWTSACDAILNLIDGNLRRAVEELTFRLAELRDSARCQGADIGLRVADLDLLLEHAGHTVMKIEDMYRVVLELRLNFLHFFTWVLDWAKQSSDESRASVASLVDCVDPERVVDFIANDLKSDRIQRFFEESGAGEVTASHVASIDSPSFSTVWIQRQAISLQTEFSLFVGKWSDFRSTPTSVISKSYTLRFALPLARCEAKAPLSLCSRSESHDQHCLAMLDTGRIVLVLSNSDRHRVARFRLAQDAVQIGFHNHTHLVVLSRDENGTHLSLVNIVEALQSSPSSFTCKEIGSNLLVEALPADLDVLVASSRQRIWPQAQGSQLAVCGPRGMVSWLNGSRRVIIVDVVHDEDDADMVDA